MKLDTYKTGVPVISNCSLFNEVSQLTNRGTGLPQDIHFSMKLHVVTSKTGGDLKMLIVQ